MLSGKLALVTGAASGIGLEISQNFAKKNATVIMVDVQDKLYELVNYLDKNNNQNHSAFLCDVSGNENVRILFEKIKEKYSLEKVPNIIVNCAGICILSSLIDTTDEIFEKVIGVNLKGPFLVTRAAAQELIKNYDESKFKPTDTYASIINIGSVSGKSAYEENPCVYSASKGGIHSMTKVVAYELAKFKIRCNAVLPGPIKTPMNDPAIRPNLKMHADMTYLKRLGESSEVAELCSFLASDSSSYITGGLLECSGGFN
jgi:NAD(P)-dependent dehydrogenase (short-subunit alcohol dehydrogenase family)